MSATRRPHEKSRRGCLECKRRRIKCSEDKPDCARCNRYGIPCVYPPPKGTRTPRPAVTPPHTTTPKLQSLSAGPTIESSTNFEAVDLALQHHWTLTTSRSIVNTDELNHIWQQVFPEIGFKHVYVMHSILSLTALHLAYLFPSERQAYITQATQHHERSLRDFRADIQNIGAHNSDAIFANSILLFFHAFLTFGSLASRGDVTTDPVTRYNQVLAGEWIPMIRGVSAVLGPLYPYVMHGPLHVLLDMKDWDSIDPETFHTTSDEHFKRLPASWKYDQHAEVYDEALLLLRKCYAFMSHVGLSPEASQRVDWGYHRAWSGPFSWLIIVSEDYMTLQKQRQPQALIIFAFFGALLQLLDGYWWVEDCGKSIVQAVEGCLGPYWSEWLAWPKQVLGLD